jgi:hypothetical protein
VGEGSCTLGWGSSKCEAREVFRDLARQIESRKRKENDNERGNSRVLWSDLGFLSTIWGWPRRLEAECWYHRCILTGEASIALMNTTIRARLDCVTVARLVQLAEVQYAPHIRSWAGLSMCFSSFSSSSSSSSSRHGSC